MTMCGTSRVVVVNCRIGLDGIVAAEDPASSVVQGVESLVVCLACKIGCSIERPHSFGHTLVAC